MNACPTRWWASGAVRTHDFTHAGNFGGVVGGVGLGKGICESWRVDSKSSWVAGRVRGCLLLQLQWMRRKQAAAVGVYHQWWARILELRGKSQSATSARRP